MITAREARIRNEVFRRRAIVVEVVPIRTMSRAYQIRIRLSGSDSTLLQHALTNVGEETLTGVEIPRWRCRITILRHRIDPLAPCILSAVGLVGEGRNISVGWGIGRRVRGERVSGRVGRGRPH